MLPIVPSLMLKVLSIAGSDPSGGAGIQADLKTFAAHRVYGAAVVTALTAQNTQGVQGVFPIDAVFVEEQLDSVFSDIKLDAIKIGMLFSRPIMEVVAHYLKKYPTIPVVLDPVMVATSGDRLLQEEAETYLRQVLIPLATLCTPNLAEAQVITQKAVNNQAAMVELLAKIAKTTGTSILLKGGHALVDSDQTFSVDMLVKPNGDVATYSLPRLDTMHTHGTGCTLSAALACRLAEGHTIDHATHLAKDYLHRALSAGQFLEIGKGRGPVWHNV